MIPVDINSVNKRSRLQFIVLNIGFVILVILHRPTNIPILLTFFTKLNVYKLLYLFIVYNCFYSGRGLKSLIFPHYVIGRNVMTRSGVLARNIVNNLLLMF